MRDDDSNEIGDYALLTGWYMKSTGRHGAEHFSALIKLV